uniref:GG24255 n=1 Tax=Drosophila erecta TaxID=7220 RepID=B3P306_DROER
MKLIRQPKLVPLVGFSPPVFTPPIRARRPSSRKDAFQFPQDIGYQENSNCQRASRLCCAQRNIGSQYDCFHHHGCSESISTIVSTCS